MTARDPAFVNRLRRTVGGEIREAEPLARYSTYRIGGPATILLPASVADLAGALRLAAAQGIPWFAIGLGSNVLLPDAGLDALVIRLGKGLDQVRVENERWTIGAGLPAPLAARRTADAGWAGLHVMVGVPGSVGGGVFMNAGCHGAQWSDVVECVTVIDRQGELRVLAAKDIPFAYRRSGLDGVIVVEVQVALHAAPAGHLAAEVAKLFEWRQKGTPFNQPCCGSVFKNPLPPATSPPSGHRTAGQLIEAVGMKGHRVGGIEVSPMHANYFVNTGGGTAADVEHLIQEVQGRVLERFGVDLEPEVKIIGPGGEYR